MTLSHKRRRRRSGFTLIEVLLVLVILVIIGSLAGTGYIAMQKGAYIDAAKVQVGLFETPLRAYRLNVGDFPTTDQGLEALREAPGDLTNPDKWKGPYLDKQVPMDPWGNKYEYEYPGTHDEDVPDIWSFGPDMANGTDDDIGNWTES